MGTEALELAMNIGDSCSVEPGFEFQGPVFLCARSRASYNLVSPRKPRTMIKWVISMANTVLDCLARWLGGLDFLWWLIDEISKDTPDL